MKILSGLLLVLSISANAAENNYFENLNKDLNNKSLYQSHHITITKEEKHRFLFIPYTKEVVVNDIVLNGPTGVINSNLKTPYVNAVSKTHNNETIIQNDILTTGLFININKLNDDKQILTFNKRDLVSLEELTVNDSTIQLPTINENSFSMPITQNSIKKTWIDNSGNTYHLNYIGKK